MSELSDFKKNHRTHHLPVDDPRHTEVLGYHVSSKVGKSLWQQLDWDNWWVDHGGDGHLFSAANSDYFHVECKDKDEGCVYRVRCWYAGGKYRGWPVVSVGICFLNGRLAWIVRTKRSPSGETSSENTGG